MYVCVPRTHEYADRHGRRRDGGAERLPDELGEPERDEGDEERERRHDERHRENDGARVRAEDEPTAAQESLPTTSAPKTKPCISIRQRHQDRPRESPRSIAIVNYYVATIDRGSL